MTERTTPVPGNSLYEDMEQFSAAISHELRDPLREAMAVLKLLEAQWGMHPLLLQTEEHIACSLRRAQLLRDYAWMALDREPRQRFELQSAFEEAMKILQPICEDSGAEIRWDTLPGIMGNYRHWVILFTHLLRNAMQYNDSLPPLIFIDCKAFEHGYELCIRDNGTGIDPAYAGIAFALFRRLDNHPKGVIVEGDGCGLAVCRRIVQNHGGTIQIVSEPGESTEIRITVPA